MKKSLVAVALIAPAILGINTALHALLPASPKASAATAVPIHRQIAAHAPVMQASAARGVLPITRTATASTTRRVFKRAPDVSDPYPLASAPDVVPHRINEVSIVVSPTGASTGSVDVTYCAFMRYVLTNDNFLDIVTSRPASGGTWTLNALESPGNGFDNSGDPELAASPAFAANSFHPKRIYLAATTWAAGTTANKIDPNVHLQNQISVWSYDPADDINHLNQWMINAPIDPHLTPVNGTGYDFDDGPTIAVSQATNTLGDVYVAYKLVTASGSHASIRFARGYASPDNSNKVAWDISTAYDPAVQWPGSTNHALDNPQLVVDPTGRIFLSWLDHGDNTVNVMTSHDEGQHWSYDYRDAGGIFAFNPIGAFPGGYASLQTGNFLSTSYSTKSGTLALVYQRRKNVWYSIADTTPGPTNTDGSEVVMRRFDPATTGTNAFSDPMIVSNRDVTSDAAFHDQWGGVVACGPDGGCLVLYYDHNVKDEPSFVNPDTSRYLFTYGLEARHFQDDGVSFSGGTGDTPLVLSNNLSDSSQFYGNNNPGTPTPGGQLGNLEYQDTDYRNGTWYAASVLTNSFPSSTSDVVVNIISCGSSNPRRIHAVKPLDDLQLYPRGWSGDLSVDLNTGDNPSVTWTEESPHFIVTPRPEHGSTITVHPGETTTYTATVTDFCGNQMKSPITVTICPTISVAPVSASATIPSVGEGSVLAQVEANGTPIYTWYHGDGTPVDTDTALTVNAGTIIFHSALPDHRDVFAKITSCGSTISTDTVTLSLVAKECALPQIYMAGSGTVVYGAPALLTAYLDPLDTHASYQWYRGSDHVLMGDGPTLNAFTTTYETYYCVINVHCISDTAGADPTTTITSPNAYLSLYGYCEVPPIATSQTTNDVPLDSSTGVTFSAMLDWGDVTFQWYEGQSGDTRKPVTADTGAPNSITVGRYSADPKAYWVRGTLSCGAFRDSDTVSFSRNGCSAILFDPQPQSAVIESGGGVTLQTDTPSAHPPASDYNWFTVGAEAGSVHAGKTYPVQPEKTTRYVVRAQHTCAITGNTNADMITESAVATIRVGSCSSISVQWPNENPWANLGDPAILTVNASVTDGTLAYQWYAGEVGDDLNPLQNAVAATYQSAPLTDPLAAPVKYWVRLKHTRPDGSFCYADSPTITVSVCVKVTSLLPNVQVERQVMPWAQTARLYYPFTGTALTYQWYLGSPGDTSYPQLGTADVLIVRPNYTTTYWVRATSHCQNDPNGQPATMDSAPIRVSVCPVIIQQPVGPSSSVMTGQTTTLTAESRVAADTLQWYVGESGDTAHPFPSGGNTLTVTTPPIIADTKFWVQFTNGSCTTNSDPVTVHVCAPLPVQWATIPKPLSPVEPFTISISGVAGEEDIFWYQGVSGDQSNPTGSPANLSYSQVGPLAHTTSFWARVQEGSCWTDLPTLTLPVCVPVISQQPAGTMINAGASWQMTVAAAPSAVTYQWYTGNSGDTSNPIAGQTASTYTAQPAVTTSYWVRVDGGCGQTADSSTATVSICQQPAIQTVTPALSIVRGTSVPFTVNATGTNLTYQWYVGTSGVTTLPVTGATSSTMSATPQDNINYWVRVSGTCGTRDSATIPVSVCANPAIATQPQNVSVFSGATATLTVAATPATSSPVTYQWYRGNAGDTSNAIAGTGGTSQSFTTPPLTTQTNYWARASCGDYSSADSQTATVSICPFVSTLPSPGNVNVAVGQTAQLSTITGTGNTYQWYTGASGNTSAGAPSTTSTLNVTPSVTTTYWCRVTNGPCVADTPAGTVNVCIPTFTQSPQSIMINPGTSTTLTSAANTPGVTYQWYTGNSSDTSHPIAGATGASYLAQPVVATSYWVRATGGCGTADSAAATVSICQIPAIQSNTSSLSIVRGQNATCQVNATGTNLTYQWYIGITGVTTLPISGATSSVLTAAPQDNITYWVRVTGTCGAVNSNTIPVNVCTSPVITTQPQSVYVFSGAAATLSVAASESTSNTATYQWYRGNSGDTSTPTGTGTSFTTPALTTQTNYWARASCSVCTPADSQTATVSICPIPATLSSPGNVNVAVGQSGHLSTITGSGNTYQWYTGASGNTSVGAPSTSSTLDIAPSVTTSYWCRVTNGTCVTNTPSGTVNVCIPAFTQSPQSITITAGSPTTLTSAANTAGVTYQWYIGATGNTSSPVSGGTSANLTVTPASTTTYWVRATGTCAVADSTAATVTICQPPVLTVPPHDSSGVYGSGNAYFSVTATGSNLTYQWYLGDSGTTTQPVSGATTNALTLPISSTTKVWVRVSGQCGSVNSATVWASEYPTVQLTTPSALTVGYNSTASITVSSSGTYLHYVWKWANGTLVSGAADSPTLITPSITSNSIVYCEVWSGAVETNSPETTLTVCYDQPTIYSLTKANNGSCKIISISTSYAYDYQWYQGVRGDVSHPAGSGYPTIYPCPGGTTQYWCRVFQTAPDGTAGCYIDSTAITVP